MTQNTLTIAGIDVACCTPQDAVATIISTATQRKGAAFHFINAYTVSLTVSSPDLKDVLNCSRATFPDGKPLTWVGRMRRASVHQIRGPELFESVLDQGRPEGVRHFLLGGTEENLPRLVSKIEGKFPGVRIVGSWSPPFRALTSDEVDAQDALIVGSGAEVVWVGLGTPKQDHEVFRLALTLPVTAVAVGAAFDFTAGTKRLAPAWVTRAGFEWFFRFINEPRRLWKRYTVGNFLFIIQIVRNWRVDNEHQRRAPQTA
ncbi:WecB/TagA/CpsF family glycosyltransferase [Kocuria arenosa]|uniref:WecB/TagA/CpsF family glycosyltransferase n=1 Tax=Kocuria arenosa TaxID=3071446 RepID=UPI0034D49C74